MKKTFELTHPKIKPARLADAIKHDVKKYVRRERKKDLPEGADYLDFECKYGSTEVQATPVHLSEINKCVDDALENGLKSFYLEVIGKPATRNKR